jgi:hypothetical protein
VEYSSQKQHRQRRKAQVRKRKKSKTFNVLFRVDGVAMLASCIPTNGHRMSRDRGDLSMCEHDRSGNERWNKRKQKWDFFRLTRTQSPTSKVINAAAPRTTE